MRTKNPDKAPAKSRHIDLRVDQHTYDAIANYADYMGISVSEYIRQMLVKGRVVVKVEQVMDPADIKRALAELGHIGSNINQILKIAGSRGILDVTEIRKALADNRVVEKMISEAYGTEWL